jgi:actin-related protein
MSFFSDEVGAIVIDAGSHSFRAGFGGEETPKVFLFVYFNLQTIFQFSLIYPLTLGLEARIFCWDLLKKSRQKRSHTKRSTLWERMKQNCHEQTPKSRPI